MSGSSMSRSIFFLSTAMALSVASPLGAVAGEQIIPQSLKIVHVSLDAATWKVDEDTIDESGDRNFSADYIDENADISISVAEGKMADPQNTADNAAKFYLKELQKRARSFSSFDCPAEFASKPGAVCVGYALSIKTPQPLAKNYAYISVVNGDLINRHLRLGNDATQDQKQAAIAAFELIDTK